MRKREAPSHKSLRSKGETIFQGCNVLFMSLFSLLMIYPLWYVIIISFNHASSGFRDVLLWPARFTMENYRVVFVNDTLVRGFINTLLRVGIGTVASLLLCSAAAYALSRKELVARNFFLNFIIVTMFFSGGLLPWYILLRDLSMLNKFVSLIFPYLGNAWYIMIMKTFFRSFPESIVEAARIDGYNDLKIFLKLVLPLSTPILATMALFFGVFYWNDWWSGEMLLTNTRLMPIQTVLMRIIAQSRAVELKTAMAATGALTGSAASVESIKMAAIVVATAPIIALYPFLQKYFVTGVMIGSIKE